MFDDLLENDAFMLGASILANNTGHYGAFAPAVGGGVQSWATNREAYLEAAEKQAQLQHLEEYIKTLPKEQQALFRAYPSLAESMFESQFGMNRMGTLIYRVNPQTNETHAYQLTRNGPPIDLGPVDEKMQMLNGGGYNLPYDPRNPHKTWGGMGGFPGIRQKGPAPQLGYSQPPPVAPSTRQPGPQPMAYQDGSAFSRQPSAPSMGPLPAGTPTGAIPKTPPPEAMPSFKGAQAMAQEQAKNRVAAQKAWASSGTQYKNTQDLIDQVITHPGLESGTGWSSIFPALPGTAKMDFNALVDQIQNSAFMVAREQLKGAGQVTDFEGMKAEQALNRARKAQKTEDFIRAMEDFKYYIGLEAKRLEQMARGEVDESGIPLMYQDGDPFAARDAARSGGGGFNIQKLSTEEIQRMLLEGRYR